MLREPNRRYSAGWQVYVCYEFLPAQRADVDVVAACVSVIEMEGFTKVKDIQLANGSNALRGMCIHAGREIYIRVSLTWDDSRCLLPNFNKVG